MWRYAKDASATMAECISQDCVQWNKFFAKNFQKFGLPRSRGRRHTSNVAGNMFYSSSKENRQEYFKRTRIRLPILGSFNAAFQ